MLRPRVALTIYRKELRETLRDRRTIVVMILLPLTLYPLLTLTFASLAASHKREEADRPSQICLVGGDERATLPGFLADRDKLRVAPRSCALEDLRSRSVQAVLEVPSGFEGSLLGGKPRTARVLYDENDARSKLAADRLHDAVAAFVNERRHAILAAHRLPESLADREPLELSSITSARENGAALLAKVLPVLVIFMVVLGAFYPAIDLTAGERERGTLETLLCAPVERLEIISGKWLATATIAALTGFLNLASMGLTVGQMLRLVDAHEPISMPWSAVLLSALAIVPSALFFAAVFMAVASLARTYKEAQSLVMPVYLCVSLPATFAAIPGSELSIGTALVPGAGVALFIKGLIQGRLMTGAAVVAMTATVVYAGASLVLAARIFASEETLLGGDGSAGMSLGRRLSALLGLRGRGPERKAPSAAEAMTLFSLVVLLLFFVAIPLQRRALVRGLLLTQWVVLLGATLTFLRASGISLASALGFSRPRLRACLSAVLMGGSTWLLLSALVETTLSRYFPVARINEDMRRTLMAQPRSLPFDLFLIAVSPAVCEELLFRGAILSGLRRALRPLPAALCCGALFGLFHLQVVRMIPTAILGTLLAWLAISGRSIVPAMIFHFLNNAAAVVLTRFGGEHALELGSREGRIALLVAAVAFLLGVVMMRGGTTRRPASSGVALHEADPGSRS
jgi:sodium transport system permease protein